MNISSQITFLSVLLNQDEVKWLAIVNDSRLIPLLSLSKECIKLVSDLNSLEIILPENKIRKVWKWHPPLNTRIWKIYQKYISSWFQLDFSVVPKKEYNRHYFDRIKFCNFYVSISLSDNIKRVIDYPKYTFFNGNIDEMIEDYITVIRSDSNIIIENLFLYKKLFKEYLNTKKSITTDSSIQYKDELINLFLDYRIYEFKNRIKFYTRLYSFGYRKLDQIYNVKTSDLAEIRYKKNICVKLNKYLWQVHKVYTVDTSKMIGEGDIMVAHNTNPEFIFAFNHAMIICVESDSELSHAAITCRELKIPLVLGAKGIFNATKNWDKISIDTIEKKIIL